MAQTAVRIAFFTEFDLLVLLILTKPKTTPGSVTVSEVGHDFNRQIGAGVLYRPRGDGKNPPRQPAVSRSATTAEA